MARSRSLLSILVSIIALGGALLLMLPPACARGHEDAARLSSQIEREKNPVKKAKLELRLAGLELEQTVNAYDHNKAAQGKLCLRSYLQEVRSSWKVLESSGRNAAKNPSGFMQLEIGLTENARVLHDLEGRLDYLQQPALDKVLNALNQLHSQVLLALFPGARPPGATAQSQAKPVVTSLARKESHP
jgi:hypothetical protein